MILVFYLLSLLVLYVVIRAAVKHGIMDAQRERDADLVRGRLGRAVRGAPHSDD